MITTGSIITVKRPDYRCEYVVTGIGVNIDLETGRTVYGQFTCTQYTFKGNEVMRTQGVVITSATMMAWVNEGVMSL